MKNDFVTVDGMRVLRGLRYEIQLTRVAKTIRDEMERIGADQGMTLADFDAIAKVVIALPCDCSSCRRDGSLAE
jgi:hypothetical protein